MSEIKYKNIIESILFAIGQAVPLKDIAEAISLPVNETQKIIEEMQSEYDYEMRGISIIKVNNSFQMTTRRDYYEYIKKILSEYTITSLSQAALETLSIVAYKQPVTRGEIEQIRGVKSTSSLDLLIDRGLVERAGTLDLPGRPSLFKTTDEFLKFAEISDINKLPAYEEFITKQLEIDIENTGENESEN